MQLIELSLADKEQYNRFVAAALSGGFLQSWEWGQWQEQLGRRVFRYKLLNDTGEQVASMQLIKMPLPLGKYYLYAPYGPVLAIGEQIQDSRFKILEFLSDLKSKFSNAVFIRTEPKESFNFPAAAKAMAGRQLSTFNLPVIKSANIQPAKTLILDLTKSNEELLAEMHPKTRYNIKLAQKHGVEIQDEFDVAIGRGLFFEEALRQISQTAKRQRFNTFPVAYYEHLADFFMLRNRGDLKLHIYKAIYQNQLLATAIMVDFGNIRSFLFGGSSPEHREVMAPYLMHFQAIEDGRVLGLKCYDFWGVETAGGQTPGFVRFKLGFGGQIKQYAGAWDAVSRKLEYRLYQFFRSINRKLKISR